MLQLGSIVPSFLSFVQGNIIYPHLILLRLTKVLIDNADHIAQVM